MINLGKTHAKLTIFPKMFCKSGPRSYGGATCMWKQETVIWHCVDGSERPVELLKPLSSTEALVGETATFTCQLSKPNKDVVWKVGDKVITASDDKYEVESHDLDYTLKIKDCTLDDAGDVSLSIGDQQTSAQLVVAG